MIEILAPAGNAESFDAALNAGADAVYLGLRRFSARNNAANFSPDELAQAVKKARLYGVRVYLTLNTLAFDDEMPQIREYICNAAECGISAVITQDLGVAAAVRRVGLPLHASTQMTVTSVEGAMRLKEWGFTRVVLARELTGEEIRRITAQSGIETEVFVHGAHCASVSGQCYMSVLFGGRSGNRGDCAQPCRLDFRRKEQSYALSLKDLSLIPHITELAEMGVASLKIEGRMKRPEYVAAAVGACYAARAGETPDLRLLEAVFSRSGFTDGYFTGNYHNMPGIRTKDDVIATSGSLAEIRSLYKTPLKRRRVNFFVKITSNSVICRAQTGDLSVTVTGAPAEPALTRAVTEDFVKEQMLKLGGTIFTANEVTVDLEPNLFISAQNMNKLRRMAVESLSERLINHDKSP
jgi:putative protease